VQRSSETIGAIATALAKAQAELTNPEKSMNATIRSSVPREPDRTFRYAPLSSGLDIVRKTLGRHEIAAVQSTEIDKEAGLIRLTTVLAHSSGEWVSSEWPVCPVTETAAPHRMGAALTYARRYALFTLVGIAGEDDLDAPDLQIEPTPSATLDGAGGYSPRSAHGSMPPRRPNGKRPNGPILAPDASATLRDQLLAEMSMLASTDEAAVWAHKALARKSTLTDSDAGQVEDAFTLRLAQFGSGQERPPAAAMPVSTMSAAITGSDDFGEATATSKGDALSPASHAGTPPAWLGPAEPEPAVEARGVDKSALPIGAPRRFRDKAHLAFVAAQPCLVCTRRPVDPHHIRFAQKQSLGRKVSDEFTVPLCRSHHRALHRSGSEYLWWENVGIDPLKAARKLWKKTRLQRAAKSDARRNADATAAAGAGKRASHVDHAGGAATILSPGAETPHQ